MAPQKDNYILRSLVCLAASVLLGNQASAQLAITEQPLNKQLPLAEEQYQQGAYRNALQSATQYLSLKNVDVHSKDYAAIDKAGYYAALAALQTDDDNSVE